MLPQEAKDQKKVPFTDYERTMESKKKKRKKKRKVQQYFVY